MPLIRGVFLKVKRENNNNNNRTKMRVIRDFLLISGVALT